MKIVIDSNILFSALIKNSMTRTIILMYEDKFLFPEFIFYEIEKHKDLILKKSKMNDKDFNNLLRLILEKVIIVPNNTLLKYKTDALRLVRNIDKDDVQFIACVLANKNSILWTDDKKLKNVKEITVINTPEIVRVLQ